MSQQNEVTYTFDTTLFGDDTWALEAQKHWQEPDGTPRRDVLLLDLDEHSPTDPFGGEVARLTSLQQAEGIEAAMNEAERLAQGNGFLDPERDDPRLFAFGPDDPFSTLLLKEREQVLSGQDEALIDTQEIPQIDVSDYPTMYSETVLEAEQRQQENAPLQESEWFEATFEGFDQELLQPLDDKVNYAVVVQADDPWTLELAVEKYWRDPDGSLGVQSVTLDTYDPQVNGEDAEQKRADLMQLYDDRGLEAMMHQAELTAMENGYLDGSRADPRLFTQGPPDRFESLAQQLDREMNPYWNTDGDVIEEPTVQSQSDVENASWRLDTLPVNDPDGEPLGYALHIVVYPDVASDLDGQGTPSLSETESVKMLEMAHFETPEAADTFGREFNGYLIPGVLEGPDLAVEVARLEGMPLEWKTLEGDELKAYQSAELTLTHDTVDWHVYNPNAEQDARIAAEGLSNDPIQQIFEQDVPEIASGPAEMDF
jgi:hypothetical protein